MFPAVIVGLSVASGLGPRSDSSPAASRNVEGRGAEYPDWGLAGQKQTLKDKITVSKTVFAPEEVPAIAMRMGGNGSMTALDRVVKNGRQAPQNPDLCNERDTLDEAETRERDEYETIIRNGWNTFLEVGRALSKIREKRLYREHHRTFEEYCRQRWDFSKTHANRLIEAAAVADVLTPIGVKVKSESHVRALVWLPPQKIVAAWRKAEALAGEGEVTARLVRQAVQDFKKDLPTDSRPVGCKRLSLNRMASQGAMRLIDQAEKAAKVGDLQAVLAALRNLRQRLLNS